jgi:Transglycosylase SLT domain
MRTRIAFCNRCLGMRVGWNLRYVAHCFVCKKWLRYSSELVGAVIFTSALLFALPEPVVPAPSKLTSIRPEPAAGPTISPTVRSVADFLRRHEVREASRARLAESIVSSATKYDLDPKLIASITVIESRGNPFAISSKAAVGVMQIHLPTWGSTAESEDLNLFKVEDNVDLGSRILKTYIRQFGLWEGVKRYNGFFAGDPESEQSAETYVAKVQEVYGFQPAALTLNLAK